MKLIDKAALLAEIERNLYICAIMISQHQDDNCVELYKQKAEVYQWMRSFIDTLEVKEVDLEDNIKESLAQKYIDYTFKRHNIDPESKEGQLIYYAYMHGMNQCLNQLKAQKDK